nr:EF-P lysine aminoacylase GenX [Parachlamydiaceae bacterium]
AITQAASIDAHIDLIAVQQAPHPRYLHSSPEYGMKRLLSEGMGDIYQLAHVYRDGEFSNKHNPEFMMAEWYRLNHTFEMMIDETADFIRLFLGSLPLQILSYRQAFIQYVGIDYVHTSTSDLLDCLAKHAIIPYPGLEKEGKDAILNLILGTLIEPYLGKNELCALAFYPASQAALAKTCQKGDELTAERFEIYYQGLELANGYHELVDPIEQRMRLIESNIHRQKLGKAVLPIDEHFLIALEKGLPDCSGVAVGFDRLMMLRHNQPISEVIPFDWKHA